MALAFKDEREIVDHAKQLEDPEICFFPAESDLAHRVLKSLRGTSLTHRERPDFEDLPNSLLLEAMQVDDHPRPGRKDATRAREGSVLRELREAGFAEIFANASLIANVNTQLPTDKDHNYPAYLTQFAKVIGDHARKVTDYRETRPGFDLGFLILDESSAYIETLGAFGSDYQVRPHVWFADRAFAEIIQAAGIDCVAWLTPYKVILGADGTHYPLPQLTIIDLGLIDDQSHVPYDAKRMKSAEL
ncbi:hypothetical protein [Glutamicibacter halophytocola]|uniref:Uncharacterized protein n=1 Tax=Glutamicibacter halophytocola TaxID=1933880 RepID=A0AA95BT18_9MICC|nr:hypothetical protein [Glutamicibacter halophytocola]ALG28966.1 hypothetical protein AOZ07_08250 [Glutamicibacter halophytocola]UUX60554.1 hypothetical protein NUH22_08120 [Glutamicibacter halophytocola]